MSVYGALNLSIREPEITLESIENTLNEEFGSFQKIMESIQVVQEDVGIVLEEEQVKKKLSEKIKEMLRRFKEWVKKIILTIKENLSKSKQKSQENSKVDDYPEDNKEKKHKRYTVTAEYRNLSRIDLDKELTMFFRRYSDADQFKHLGGEVYEKIKNSNQAVFDKYNEILESDKDAGVVEMEGTIPQIIETNKELYRMKHGIFNKIMDLNNRIEQLEKYIERDIDEQWSNIDRYDRPMVAGSISADIINLKKAHSIYFKIYNALSSAYWKNSKTLDNLKVKINGNSVHDSIEKENNSDK